MDNPEMIMRSLDWLTGRWVIESGESVTTEIWEKISDELLSGSSETIKNGVTVFSEKLSIKKVKKDIYYIADVTHNPEPVFFKLLSQSQNDLVFENAKHDFPQKITYRNERTRLHVWIEGPGKNKNWETIEFYFKKAKL